MADLAKELRRSAPADHGLVGGWLMRDAADEIERLRTAIRSFERADTEMRRAEATMEQPRLQRAGDRWAMARYRLFLAAKQSSVGDTKESP